VDKTSFPNEGCWWILDALFNDKVPLQNPQKLPCNQITMIFYWRL